jgi:hypothetical protein
MMHDGGGEREIGSDSLGLVEAASVNRVLVLVVVAA